MNYHLNWGPQVGWAPKGGGFFKKNFPPDNRGKERKKRLYQ